MITIIRKDGTGLVISSARTLMDNRKGLIADYGDEMYIVEDFNLHTLAAMTTGRFGNMIVIHKEWKGWPDSQ